MTVCGCRWWPFEHLHWIQNSRISLISILLLYKYSSYDYWVIFFISKGVYIILGHSVCTYIICLFLGSFAELPKMTVSFVVSPCPPACLPACLPAYLSVCLSVRLQQLCYPFTDFHKFWYSNIFRKSISLNSDKNNRYFTGRPMYIYGNISLNS